MNYRHEVIHHSSRRAHHIPFDDVMSYLGDPGFSVLAVIKSKVGAQVSAEQEMRVDPIQC